MQVAYELPMAEVGIGLLINSKSVTRGYASLDYHFLRFQEGPFVRVDTLINGDRVDAPVSSCIVIRPNAVAVNCAKK